MSSARHHTEKKEHGKKHRASGGGLPEIAGGDPQVLKEARSKTKNVGVIEGERAKPRGDRMAVKRGGKVHERARGGRVSGSDMNPFSSAHGSGPVTKTTHADEMHEEAHAHGGKVHPHHSHTHKEDHKHGGHVKSEHKKAVHHLGHHAHDTKEHGEGKHHARGGKCHGGRA